LTAAANAERAGERQRGAAADDQAAELRFFKPRVEVSEDFEANLSPTLGDAQQLQQVFLNILNNAYDAIQESGITGGSGFTRASEDDIEVAFTDNGTGVVDPNGFSIRFLRPSKPGKAPVLG